MKLLSTVVVVGSMCLVPATQDLGLVQRMPITTFISEEYSSRITIKRHGELLSTIEVPVGVHLSVQGNVDVHLNVRGDPEVRTLSEDLRDYHGDVVIQEQLAAEVPALEGQDMREVMLGSPWTLTLQDVDVSVETPSPGSSSEQ